VTVSKIGFELSVFGFHRHNRQIGESFMTRFIVTAKKLLVREEGPTMAEYGLMVAVVALVAVVGAASLGTDLSSFFTAVGTRISSYAP
jgi:Flp pilus assembly pilin Flp